MIVRSIEKDELCLSENELLLRLAMPRSAEQVNNLDVLKEKVFSRINCKMVAERFPVSICDGSADLGFCKIKSENLCRSLGDSAEAFVFAVTLGMDVDRYLLSLSKLSVSQHFISDAIASAFAEAAADRAQEILDGYARTKKRFSPGYGDLSLEIQKDVLSVLSADKALGINLDGGLLMKPQKSITAIVGIK